MRLVRWGGVRAEKKGGPKHTSRCVAPPPPPKPAKVRPIGRKMRLHRLKRPRRSRARYIVLARGEKKKNKKSDRTSPSLRARTHGGTHGGTHARTEARTHTHAHAFTPARRHGTHTHRCTQTHVHTLQPRPTPRTTQATQHSHHTCTPAGPFQPYFPSPEVARPARTFPTRLALVCTCASVGARAGVVDIRGKPGIHFHFELFF